MTPNSYLSSPPHSKDAVLCLGQWVLSVMDWMGANRLKLNPGKTKMLLIGCMANQGIETPPVLDGMTLPLKTQVSSLGLLLDSSLSLDTRVSAKARSAFALLKLVC